MPYNRRSLSAMDNNHEQEIYSGACGLNDPEEIEDCTCELLMRSSGPIGYRMKIFMKAVDGTAGPITIHPEMSGALQE